jgi:Mce-associated membrane protein
MTADEAESSAEHSESAIASTEAPTEAAASPPRRQASAPAVVLIGRLTEQARAYWRPIVLVALVIASIGLAAGLFVLQYRPDREIDDRAADQAVRAASDGAVALLSYSSDSLDRDFADAKTRLTGEFLDYYIKFTRDFVAPTVRDKHLTQKAVAIRSAAVDLHPKSAVVLVFLNETTTSADKKEPLKTPSSVRVTLEKVDGSWLISKLDPVG